MIELAKAFWQLGKPRLSLFAVFPVFVGFYLGRPSGSDQLALWCTSIGTYLVAMGGNALNMLIERSHDQQMERTKGRPLASGSLSPAAGQVYGLTLGLGGLGLLFAFGGTLAGILCVLIFLLYVFVYTPLKRRTELNTLVGAIPGALPPMVGYAAATGVVDLRSGVLFLILFFWQIPHFLAIAWRYREDYERGGMLMITTRDEGGRRTAQQMMLYTAALIVVSFLPFGLRMAGEVYLVVALCLNILFGVVTFLAAILRWESAMRQTFLVSIVYIPALLGVMVLDRVTVTSG